jgi:hypothetical protein
MAQSGEGLSLVLGLAFYAMAVLLLFKVFPSTPTALPSEDESLSPYLESFLFLLILALGIYLRAFGANHYPMGIFSDRAEIACGALRILHDHWRPSLEALELHVPELCIYYMAAGWFKAFGESPEVFSYFDVFLSTAGIAGMYAAFRLWSGPLPALLAFFLLAVMRWNFAFAHQVYFQSQTVLFMSLALSGLYYALRKQKPLGAALGGLALGAGLYSYQSLKALPLLVLALMFFEIIRDREGFKKNRESWAVFWLVSLLTALPLVGWMIHTGELGRREPEVSLLARIHAEQSLWPILENARDLLLVFNHKMFDGNSQSNFSHHRILDDVTGVFFILGFFYAFRKIREKPYFIALAGLVIMSCPGFFSINGSNLGRLLGATPFVVYLCALFIAEVWDSWKSTRPSPYLQRIVLAISVGLLSMAGFENYYLYFHVQAHDPDCVNDCSWPESRAGSLIAGLPHGTQSFMTSRFYAHPTVKYLTYPNWEGMHPLDLSHPPQPGNFPKDTDFCFVLDEFRLGTLEFLQSLYPGGVTKAFQNPLGNVTLYAYQVPAKVLIKFPAGTPLVVRGLWGDYRNSEPESKPFINRWDPILNFNYRDLPGVGGPLFIHWTGKFLADRGGLYRLWGAIFATSRGRILVDRKDSLGFSDNPLWEGWLNPGWHQLDYYYRDEGSPVATVSLLWKPPGQKNFDFIPNEVLGKIE